MGTGFYFQNFPSEIKNLNKFIFDNEFIRERT